MKEAEICAYELPDGARIERCQQRDGNHKWAVRHNGDCLANDGHYEWEPSPSNRDDAFMARCRYDSAETAYAAWEARVTPSI